MAVSFESEIKPLFRQNDIDSMKSFGKFDLSSHNDVSLRADDILSRLENGSMPCDGAWPQSDVDKFRQWVKDGKLA